MILTNDNYFSEEAMKTFMSASQFKAFRQCEAAAVAEIRGELIKPTTDALLTGSYVDAYFSGEMEEFITDHPDIYNARTGDLKAKYKTAEACIARAESDPFFMNYISGQMQPIETGEIEGVPVKIKIDALHSDKIVDLKVMRDLRPIRTEEGLKTFIDFFGYDVQAYMYQTIHEQVTGRKLPFFFAVITKEASPDLAVIEIPQWRIDQTGPEVKHYIKRYDRIKKGHEEPERCEHCDYCKATRKLTAAIKYEDLLCYT